MVPRLRSGYTLGYTPWLLLAGNNVWSSFSPDGRAGGCMLGCCIVFACMRQMSGWCGTVFDDSEHTCCWF
jgi:hypothetical protein